MALWLVHTYAAYKLGVWETECQHKEAFLVGNISPDWINFVPDGRRLYRRKSHYRHQETAQFMLDKFMQDYENIKGDTATEHFYKGYGFHIILDDVWGKKVYFKYFGEKMVPKSYYEDCMKWDNIIRYWAGGEQCIQFLKGAVDNLDGLNLKQNLVDNEILKKMFLAAKEFEYGNNNEMPHIVKEQDIIEVISEAKDIYKSLFS